METSKIITRALELKSKGFENMASVVKSHFSTKYYHVVSIEKILKAGKWIPADKIQFSSGAHGRKGMSERKIDWTKTAKK
jgi:hypothetical protein